MNRWNWTEKNEGTIDLSFLSGNMPWRKEMFLCQPIEGKVRLWGIYLSCLYVKTVNLE